MCAARTVGTICAPIVHQVYIIRYTGILLSTANILCQSDVINASRGGKEELNISREKKSKARTAVVGRGGGESLLSDPGSDFRLLIGLLCRRERKKRGEENERDQQKKSRKRLGSCCGL